MFVPSQLRPALLLLPLALVWGCSEDAAPAAPQEPVSLAPWEDAKSAPKEMPALPADDPAKKEPMEDPTPTDEGEAAEPESADAEAAAEAAATAKKEPAAKEPATKTAGTGQMPAKADAAPAKKEKEQEKAKEEEKTATGPLTFTIETAGKARFLIDAPLEKIKGRWSRFGGRLQIDPADLNKTRGEVLMDVSTLKTYTFGDPGKDKRQTGHALNWLEIGPDVTPEMRKKYSVARFSIDSVSGATGNTGEQTVTANGKLMLHGVTVPKTVKLKVTVEGPADAPTGYRIQTAAPMIVSLEKHDVKPRDLAGRFLAGALEKVGEKITDRSQVSLDLKAVPKK